MFSELLQILKTVNGHRENKLKAAQYIFAKPNFYKDLITICFMTDKIDSYKT
jgi:hypothetical protein